MATSISSEALEKKPRKLKNEGQHSKHKQKVKTDKVSYWADV